MPLYQGDIYLAESVGVEPTQRLLTTVGLAIRCLTIRPTLLNLNYVLVEIPGFEPGTSRCKRDVFPTILYPHKNLGALGETRTLKPFGAGT